MIHFERRLGASWPTDQKPVGFVALPVDPTPVQSGNASLRIGHVDTWALFKAPEAHILPMWRCPATDL